MGELIGIIIIIGITVYLCKKEEWKYNKRICPPGKEIDYTKANCDLALGLSKQEYYRRYNSGYYDRDKK